jgi:hypothetical protein
VLGPAAEQAVAKAAPDAAPADPGETALSVGVTLAEAIFAAVTVFMVAYYWLTERVEIKRAFTSLFPRDRRQRIGTIWNEIERVMGAWMRGQLLLMLFIGVACAIGYTLLGLRYALLLALIAGLLEVVPIVGPYLGAIPAILVALTQDVQLAVYVALFTLVIQLVEGNVLVPRVMAQTLGVSSPTVVLGLLVGAALGGTPGALVAVPVAAAVQVVVKHLVMLDPEVAPGAPPRARRWWPRRRPTCRSCRRSGPRRSPARCRRRLLELGAKRPCDERRELPDVERFPQVADRADALGFLGGPAVGGDDQDRDSVAMQPAHRLRDRETVGPRERQVEHHQTRPPGRGEGDRLRAIRRRRHDEALFLERQPQELAHAPVVIDDQHAVLWEGVRCAVRVA